MGKTYRAARQAQDLKPVTFSIEDEHFEIPQPLPGFILLDFSELSEASGGQAVKAFAEFYRQCLGAEDYKRFRKVCADYRVPLKADMSATDTAEDELSLLAIAQDIIQEASGLPTEQRSESAGEPSKTGTSSGTDV